MKTFLIFSCLLATAAAMSTGNLNKVSETWKSQIANCAQENGFDNMTLQEILEKEEKDGAAKSTCFHDCMLKSIGVLNRLGIIDGSELIKSTEAVFAGNPELIKQLSEAAIHCVPKAATVQNKCRKAYVYSLCYLNSN